MFAAAPFYTLAVAAASVLIYGDESFSYCFFLMIKVEVVASARVPIVKFHHISTGRAVDICFNMISGIQMGIKVSSESDIYYLILMHCHRVQNAIGHSV